MWRVGFRLVLVYCFAGCTGLRPVVQRFGEHAEAETQLWKDEILRSGQDGDWLVIRGYSAGDHLVAVATNAGLSHVGILDKSEEEVIEAVAPVVRTVSLQLFLERADRVVLIRPHDANVESGSKALAKARSKLGAPYDFLGTVGLPDKTKFYCSKLAAWSVDQDVDRDLQVLQPAEMVKLGTVIYDSDSRSNN